MNYEIENYKDEVIKSEKSKVICFIIILFFIGICLTIRQYILEQDIMVMYIAIFFLICLTIFSAVSYYFGIYKKKKFIKNRDNILKNGIHVIGNIISKEKFYNPRETRRHYYFVKVKLKNNNEEMIIKSPYLKFHPDYIKSDFVDVYIYENQYYITNYKLDTETMQRDKLEHKKNTINKTLLIGVIMPILFITLVYLNIKEIISPKTFAIIFIGSFIAIGIYYNVKAIINSFKE